MTHGRPDIQQLLASRGIRPRRSLGQNFVADPNTVRRIARLAELGPGDRVVEIGAGLGSLTLALAETGARVVALEVDATLVEILASHLAGSAGGDAIELHHADALSVDWSALLVEPDGQPSPPGSWTMVGNLPYNVATPLVIQLLEGAPAIQTLLVMVQREVGERMVASPGSGTYGAVSVKVAYWGTARVVGRVPAAVFLPIPSVESVLVRITRHVAPAVPEDVASYRRFDTVLRTAFGQRRKMLRRSLSGVVDPDAYGALGISAEARPEELGVEQWGQLAGWNPT
jgi:16S rRNA (adenine1518-N6/adenine1519-N6)-dimethyltransferase